MSEEVSSKRTSEFLDDLTYLSDWREKLDRARRAVARVVVGQNEAIDQLFIGLMCGGHVLVEGAPGLGKTLLVRTVGEVCGLRFSRIQFTPDLMPADITGTVALLYDDGGRAHTRFQPGPIFSEMVLADEINRATPKTQSALLEAMQEQTVTVAGVEHRLPQPFFVLATQNPIEMEGTYRLPEAQVDRFFFKVKVSLPSEDVLESILELTTGSKLPVSEVVITAQEVLELQTLIREVLVSTHVRRCVARFVLTTQPSSPSAPQEVRRFVPYGVSPRGAQSLLLAAKAHAFLQGRNNVSMSDIRAVAVPALRHRFDLNIEGEMEGINSEVLLTNLLEQHLE